MAAMMWDTARPHTVLDLIEAQVPGMLEDEAVLKADGFDEAVIGLDIRSGVLVYSYKKCIEILVAEGMTEEDAVEHFHFNVAGAWVGEKTPIFVDDDWQDFEVEDE